MHHYSRCSNEIIDMYGKFLNGSCFDNDKFNNTNEFKYLLFVNNYLGHIFYIICYGIFVTLYCSCQSIAKVNCSLNRIIHIVFTITFFFFLKNFNSTILLILKSLVNFENINSLIKLQYILFL